MRIHLLQLAHRVFRAIVSNNTVLIMTRTNSDSNIFNLNKIYATFAIVGLVSTGVIVTNIKNANALDAHLRISSVSGKSFTRHVKSVREQTTRKVKKHLVKNTVKKAFSNFGHKDQSRFILINFDAPIAAASIDNSIELPRGYSAKTISINAYNPKIIHVDKNTPRNKQYSKNTTRPSKGSALKLIAGGLKQRTNFKSVTTAKGGLKTFTKQSRGITGLQEVAIPKNRLQYVAGNGQNRLGSYIANNCSDSLVCVLPDFGAKKLQTAKRFVVAISDTKHLTQLPKAKTTQQAIADTPKVILLDEIFQ